MMIFMAFDLTQRTRRASKQDTLRPNLVLEIDGVDTLYGAIPILETLKYGATGVTYGGGYAYGDLIEIEDQESFISFSGTTTSIKQTVDPDRGLATTVSSFKVALIDQASKMTKLITPGEVVNDLLSKPCRLYYGFSDSTAFPRDYIVLFRGIVDDISAVPGLVTLNIAHPDTKKRQEIYPLIETELVSDINDSVTSFDVLEASGLLEQITGPDGTIDTDFTTLIQINNEIMEVTNIATNTLTVVRSRLGTDPSAHTAEDQVSSRYRLEGDAMEVALKLMYSGKGGPWAEAVTMKHFVNQQDVSVEIANSMFFENIDLKQRYGIHIGDFVSVTGATEGANNVTNEPVTSITVDDSGTTLVLGGAAALVAETDTAAIVDFRSMYDVWPDGLAMSGEEVDADGHELLRSRFLSSFLYDFLLRDALDGREFIEQQVYVPAAAFTVPRKAASSVGYHIGPVPGEQTLTFDETNIKNPKSLKVRRTINRNFENVVVFKYDASRLEEDKFLNNELTLDATSQAQIDVGNKVFTIESQGMRTENQAQTLAQTASDRRLKRYSLAAEFFENVPVFMSTAFNLEVGDIMILDLSNLEVPDTDTGARGFGPRLMEITSKTINLKTGETKLNMTDTGFQQDTRYGLFSPTSEVKFGTSTTVITITECLPSRFGSDEGAKWARFLLKGLTLTVRSPDFTTRVGTAEVSSISGNQITFKTSLGFVPLAGDLVHLPTYNTQTEQLKLLYTHMRDTAPFDDGEELYTML